MASERRRYLLHFGVKLIIVQHGAKNFLDICGGWSGIGVFFIESLHVFQDGFEMAFELVSKRFAQHFFAVFRQDGKVRGDCVAVLGECDIWLCQPFTSERLQSFEYFRRLRCLIGTSIRCYEASGTLLPPLDSIISNDERLRTSFFLL